MSSFGSSILNTISFISRGGGDTGPIGPVGPTGSTGNTGPTGPTGNTGIGVYDIQKIDNNSIKIFLRDSAGGVTSIDVVGLSGSAPATSDVGNLSYYIETTNPSSQGVLLVQGLNAGTNQASFKVFQGSGVTFTYSGNDVVISAPSMLAAGSPLQDNNVLGVSGATATIFTTTDGGKAFDYYQRISGITTYEFTETTIAPFLQSLTSNLNATGAAINLLNTDVVINQFYYDAASSSWINKNTIKLTGADLQNSSKTLTYTDTVFSSGSTAVYPYIEKVGSCCFCNIFSDNGDRTTGVTYSDNRCIDYVTKQACDNIGGIFSEINSCDTRINKNGEAACSQITSPGICCTCGTNNSTGTNTGTCVSGYILPKSYCEALFGASAWVAGVSCTGYQCPSPCSNNPILGEKKKLVRTSEKGYPSRFTCGIDEDGNVICWGPLITAKKEIIRSGITLQDYAAHQIAVGENQVVILAHKVVYEADGITPKVDPATSELVLDKDNTTVRSISFVKSPLENKLQDNGNIFKAAFVHYSPFETSKIVNLSNQSEIPEPTYTFDGYPYRNTRNPTFIGIKYPEQTLFAGGKIYNPNDPDVLSGGAEPVLPLPQAQFKDIVSGVQHVVGIRADDGSVVCWGSNEFGEGIPPSGVREFDQVAAGRYHTVGLRKNGDIICWGAGLTGKGGTFANQDVWPNYGQSIVPESVKNKQIIQIGAGFYYTAALLANGEVEVWGSFRGLTYNDTTLSKTSDFNYLYPYIKTDITRRLVDKPTDLTKVKEIVCRPYSIVALKDDGTLVAWGDDSSYYKNFGQQGLTGYGYPSLVTEFYRTLNRYKTNIVPKFDQIAVDDENIFGLQNIYSCPGVTSITKIEISPTITIDSSVSRCQGCRPDNDPLKTKALYLYRKTTPTDDNFSDKECIRCIELNETELSNIDLFLSPLADSPSFLGVGITYPWEDDDTLHAGTTYSYKFLQGLSGWGLSLAQSADNFKCYDGITHIWHTLRTNDPNGTTWSHVWDEVYNIDTNSVYPACSVLQGCFYDKYRPYSYRNQNKACINCKYMTDCFFEDWNYQVRQDSDPDYGSTAGLIIGNIGENCYNSIDKTYFWDSRSPLPDTFKDVNGNTLGRCADMNDDGILNNDEDDTCEGGQKITAEQYVWDINFDNLSTIKFKLEPIIHNVKCLNRDEDDQFWANADQAYSVPPSKLEIGNMCYRTRSNILSSASVYSNVKQEIFLLSNSGNGSYYVMKPDKTYIDGRKLLNYEVLNPGAVNYFPASNSYLSGILGNRTEILTIKDVDKYAYLDWNNSELLSEQNSSLFNCDQNIVSFYDRDFSPNNFCGLLGNSVKNYADFRRSTNSRRKVLSGAFGHGHGMYVVAGSDCVPGDTLADCSTGYVTSLPNATGLTALNQVFVKEWFNPITAKQETNIYEYSSKVWIGADYEAGGYTGPIKITGITYSIENTKTGTETQDKVLTNYNASCGYYHSCVVLGQTFNVFSGLTTGISGGQIYAKEEYKTYYPGEVLCWGVGEDPTRTNTFNYNQADIPRTDTPARQVSCGKYHTAVLYADKKIKVYGAGSVDNPEGFNFKQSQIPENFKNSSFEYVSCGSYHTIGVQGSGVVIGWGYNNGYLDEYISNYSYKQLARNPIRVVSGNSHNIFLLEDGTVECSGMTALGQCDICENPLYNKKKYKWVDAKEDVTLAVDLENVLYLFGNIKNTLENVPDNIRFAPPGRRVISVASGQDHNLALLGFKNDPINYGEIFGWGYSPQLNSPVKIPDPYFTTGSSSNTTVMVYQTDRKPIKMIGDGSYYPYILEKVYRMGLIDEAGNSEKTLPEIIADGGPKGSTAIEYFDFIRKEKLKDPNETSFGVEYISAGGLRSFAIRSVKDVRYSGEDSGSYSYIIPWGRNYEKIPQKLNSLFLNTELDKVGFNIRVKRFKPVEIKNGNLFVCIKIQEQHIVGETSTVAKEKICVYYDADTKQSLARGNDIVGVTSSDPLYGDLLFLSYTKNGKVYDKFSKFSVNLYHIIAVIDAPGDPLDKTVVTWGFRDSREDLGQFWSPIDSNGDPIKFKDVSAGRYHNIGILEDDTVYCWGAGTEQILDVDSTTVDLGQSIVPIDITGNSIKAKSISAGAFHSMAILLDDTVVAWGAGSENYAAFDSKPNIKQATVPKGLKAIQISAGEYHSLAVTPDYRLVSWGSNETNETINPFDPTERFNSVAGGDGYSLALTREGGVLGWGYGSYESPDTSAILGGTSRLFGANLLSAAPPKGTRDVSTADEYPYDRNKIGHNGLILFNDFVMRDKAICWGDNTYKQTELIPQLRQNTIPSQDYRSTEWFPFNFFTTSEEFDSFNYFVSDYNVVAGYGGYYFSGYGTLDAKEDVPVFEPFIYGIGLNSGMDWYRYKISSGTDKFNGIVSKIAGITGIGIPIFADVVSLEANKNKLAQKLVSNSAESDTAGVKTIQKYTHKGYYGITPEDFWIFTYNGTALQSVYRSDLPALKTRDDPAYDYSQKTTIEGVTYCYYNASNSQYLKQYGINWGIKPFTSTLTIGEYDWKDAYSFALGWNPFTNTPVDFFDLNHNLWNIKTNLKNSLNTDCSDCDIIKDIKAGFTPLESLSGRYGFKVDSQKINGSNLHNTFNATAKVCGKLDLNDPDISRYLYKVNIQKTDGTFKIYYLLETALLFGENMMADTRYTFPFHNYGLNSEHQDKEESQYSDHFWVNKKIRSIVNLPFNNEVLAVFRYDNKSSPDPADSSILASSIDDNAICNVRPLLGKRQKTHLLEKNDTEKFCEDEQRWLMIPDLKSNQQLQICFRVNGLCSFGDNSRGQFGAAPDNGVVLVNYKPKAWIPAFLSRFTDGSYNTFIKSGDYHTLFSSGGNHLARTFKDPIIEYRLFGDVSKNQLWDQYFAELSDSQIRSELNRVFTPVSGQTLSPSYFYFTGEKPYIKERYVVEFPCGREPRTVPVYYEYSNKNPGITLPVFGDSEENELIYEVLPVPPLRNPSQYYPSYYLGDNHAAFLTKDKNLKFYGEKDYGVSNDYFPVYYSNQIQHMSVGNNIFSSIFDKGAKHNVLLHKNNEWSYPAFDTTPKLYEGVVQSSDTIVYTIKNLDGTVIDSNITVSPTTNNLTDQIGQTITTLVYPAGIANNYKTPIFESTTRYGYNIFSKSDTSFISWGANQGEQVYSPTDAEKYKLKEAVIPVQITDQSITNPAQIQYQVRKWAKNLITDADIVVAGLSHTALVTSYELSYPPKSGIYPAPTCYMGRVSQGFTYANPTHEITILGNNSKNQKVLPPRLKQTLAGVTVFEIDASSNEIKLVTVSPNNEWLCYYTDNTLFIISATDALRGVLGTSTILSSVNGVQLSTEIINDIKFGIDNTLFIGCESGKLLSYTGLSSGKDYIGFTLSAPESYDAQGSNINWRSEEPFNLPLSSKDRKFLDVFDLTLFEYELLDKSLNIQLIVAGDGEERVIPLNGAYTYNYYNINITDYRIQLPTYSSYTEIGLYLKKPTYSYTPVYEFRDFNNNLIPVKKINICDRTLNYDIAIGLGNGKVAFRRAENSVWQYLPQKDTTPVTALKWGYGESNNFINLTVGHESGLLFGFKPYETILDQFRWSSKYGSLNRETSVETLNWCDKPEGSGECPSVDDCTGFKISGKCACFRSGKITSIANFAYNVGGGIAEKQGELATQQGLLFISKNYDEYGNPLYNHDKCNPLDQPDEQYSVSTALSYMKPHLAQVRNQEGLVLTKMPALIGRIGFENVLAEQKVNAYRTYFNTDHLEWDKRLHTPGYEFTNLDGFTGGYLVGLMIGRYTNKIFTIGSDNDIRIQNHNIDNVITGLEVDIINKSYYRGELEAESNICAGDRDPVTLEVDKNYTITAYDLYQDENHMVVGTKNGKLRVWNTSNKSVLSSDSYLKIDNIQAGDNHTCLSYSSKYASTGFGHICWGDNSKGQCNIPKQLGYKSKYDFYPNNVFFTVFLRTGGNNTCIGLATGFTCFGSNDFNQLNINSRKNIRPTTISVGRNFITGILNSGACPESGDSGDTVVIEGDRASTLNVPFSVGGWLYPVAAYNNMIVKYDAYCGYTGPIYKEAWDLFGRKIKCGIPYTIFDGTSETQLSVLFAYEKAVKRYDLLNGFNSVYIWGDDTYGQSKWPLDKSTIGFTGFNAISISPSSYHPEQIASESDLTCSPCGSIRGVGYVRGCSDVNLPNDIGNYYISTQFGMKNEFNKMISVGGYHNVIDLQNGGYYGVVNSTRQSFVIPNSIGWGRNDYGQATIENIPPTSAPLSITNNKTGLYLTAKYTTTVYNTADFFGTGYTLSRQLNNTPYYYDIGIGNNYGFYSHESGYVLENVALNSLMAYYIRRNQFVNSTYFQYRTGGLYAPIRTYRTIKKIRTGKDYALFLTTEGRIATPIYYTNYKLPRHFTSISLNDFDINNPPPEWGSQAMRDIQIGDYHVLGLTDKGTILTWGVPPEKKFARQYAQTFIPQNLQNSRNVVQIAAGKYHNVVVTEVFANNKYYRSVISFGEPANVIT